ncbi:putative dehydrogenase [uncultured Alphaproteobacteria bacterium]|uniref:Putative dehydrogenase n=1 Tax=uncultured Alphaproteobacteria bacterium TaxID=91750 RepID=A0A212KDF0_9PROT|nr:putative dehydrogenase [uncultured Alphaproteobacteria bacterium]
MTHAPASPILVVGSGSIARRHIANLRILRPENRILVLRRQDSDSPPLPEGVEAVADVETALAERPLATILANPAPFRVALARRLAEADCHLFLEKPLSTTPDGIADLLQTAAERKLAVLVGYNLRFLPSVRAFADAVKQGMAGGPLRIEASVGQYLPDWRPDADYRHGVSARAELGGGALLELSHELDLALFLGGPAHRVSARLANVGGLGIDVEDTADLLLDFATGAQGTVHMDFLQRAPHRAVRVIGSEATLEWDYFADRVTLRRTDAETENLFQGELADRNRMYLDEMRHFFACVTQDATPQISGEEGFRVVRVIHAARNSARHNSAFVELT